MSLNWFVRDDNNDTIDITGRVRLLTPDVTMMAEEGAVGTSQLEIDDPLGDLFIHGHKLLWALEDEIADPLDQCVYAGYTYRRTETRGPYRTLAGRIIKVEVGDLNTILSRRVMVSSARNRPDETDVERVQAAEASPEGGLIGDHTYLSTDNPVNMDAKDLLGYVLLDLIKTAGDQSGKNYFLHNMPHTNSFPLPSLWYDRAESDAYPSDVRISNVIEDVTGDETGLTWYAGPEDEAEFDPSRVYSGAFGQYDGGWAYRTRPATADAFAYFGRDTTIPLDDITKATTANRRLDRMLRDMSTEDVELTLTTDAVPRRLLNMVKAGQTLQVRMTHMTGFEEFVWCRILSKQWREVGLEPESGYRVTLHVSPAAPVPEGGNDSRAVVTWPHAPSGVNTNPLHWFNDGDNYHAGDQPEPLVGNLAYLGSEGDRTGIEVLEDMVAKITFRADAVYVVCVTSTITASILVNGVPVATDSTPSPTIVGGPAFTAPSLTLELDGYDLFAGDIVRAEWSISPDPCGGYGVPAGAGGGNNHLRVTSGAF